MRCWIVNKTVNMTATTLISHDSEAETQITCSNERCHRRDVTYQATDEQIRALIAVCSTCRQFVKKRCRYSVMMWSESNPFSAWISAKGITKYNWDGSVGEYYCACGGTGTCLQSSRLSPPRCNCDINDPSRETADEGYLTSKDDLPIQAVLFGDGNQSIGSRGYYTVGKLECDGTA